MRTPLAALAIAAAMMTPAVGDLVERRGQSSAIEGTVTRVGEDGVEIATESGARHMVPWDRVRRVESERHASQIATMMPIAESLWRARSRVERGDTLLAEALFERLFERYRGQSNETAVVVAEGLLRCRLARGEQALAVIPALELARLRRLNLTTDAYRALPPVLDAETLLCPQLPPLLPEGPGLERLRGEAFDTTDPVVRAMAAAYRAAPTVRRDGVVTAARPLAALDERAIDHPGATLLDALVRASVASDQRAVLVDALVADAERMPSFAQPWLHVVHGLALIDDDDPAAARRGVVRLLRIPALHIRRQPWLAGSALLVAAHAEHRVGDPDAAAILRRELQSSFHSHPLVSAPPRRAVTAEESS